LLSSPIEGNLLYLAYQKPISIRTAAESIGIPVAYLEPIADKLVNGELLGRTDSGLIYTRCFMTNSSNSLGNIQAQEALADKYAERIWSVLYKNIEPLTKKESFTSMNDKQKATLMLYSVKMLTVKLTINPDVYKYIPYDQIPERPNGGRWLAIATEWENEENTVSKYSTSGPAYARCDEKEASFEIIDFQSVFGNTHHSYGKLKYSCSVHNAARLIVSFINDNIRPDDDRICSLVPDFEALHILKKDENGKITPDIPILSFEEREQWDDAISESANELIDEIKGELLTLIKSHKNNVPNHVDCREQFISDGALGAYAVAQMLAIANKGLIQYPITIGDTPVIVLIYRENKNG